MRRTMLILLALIILLFSGCSNTNSDKDGDRIMNNSLIDEVTEIAQAYIIDFLNEDFTKLYENYKYTPKMKSAISPEIYSNIYNQLEEEFGKYISTKATTNSQSQGFQIITVVTEFEKKYLNLNVVFEDNDVAGFNYTINKDYEESKNNSTLQVEFGQDPYIINGELNIPEGNGPFPTVIIVHGSGPVDRDGTVASSTPYKDISDGLTKKGIAVLTYDKRTYTYSDELASNIDKFTVYDETIDDVVYALNYLKTFDGIDSNNIFILGHSFGGYLIPRIIERTHDAKGYLILAGNVSPIEDLIIKQYDYLFNLDGNISEEEQNQLNLITNEIDKLNNIEEHNGEIVLGASYDYWSDLRNYDPITMIKEFTDPVLFLQGERDYQVTMEEFNKWKNSLENIENFTFKTYKTLNHLFISGEGTPTPNEYASGESVSNEVITDIADFIFTNK